MHSDEESEVSRRGTIVLIPVILALLIGALIARRMLRGATA
jgi:hypothetical protein